MTRDEFRAVVEESLEKVVATAEQRLNRKLPRKYCLSGLAGNEILPDQVVEYLTNWIFVDESHIYPCVDLFLDEFLADGRLRFRAYRAGYQPCAFGEHADYKMIGHDAGRVGPFKIGCHGLVERMKAARNEK